MVSTNALSVLPNRPIARSSLIVGARSALYRGMRHLDTGTTELLAHVDQGVAVLTMNRPERRNALSRIMLDALALTLAMVEADDEVGAVVLTGAGGAFCAGGDVKGMADDPLNGDRDQRIRAQQRNQRATSGLLWAIDKPTIAALRGAAAGAGLALALACDFRYVSSNAVFTTAFAKVGLAGDYGGTWFLTRLVGSARARELYLLADRFDAHRAQELGLVNEVFEPDELEGAVRNLARRLADGPRIAHGYMKRSLNYATTHGLLETMDIEVVHHHAAGATQDHREAAQAFVAKRTPVFRGR